MGRLDVSLPREMEVTWEMGPPAKLTLQGAVGPKASRPTGRESITRDFAENLLDKLEPWLREQLDRLLAGP